MHRAERCRPRWSWRTIIKAFPFCGETLNDYYENFSGMGPAIRPVGRCLGRVGRTELRTVPVHSYLRILQQKSSLCVEPVHSPQCTVRCEFKRTENKPRKVHSLLLRVRCACICICSGITLFIFFIFSHRTNSEKTCRQKTKTASAAGSRTFQSSRCRTPKTTQSPECVYVSRQHRSNGNDANENNEKLNAIKIARMTDWRWSEARNDLQNEEFLLAKCATTHRVRAGAEREAYDDIALEWKWVSWWTQNRQMHINHLVLGGAQEPRPSEENAMLGIALKSTKKCEENKIYKSVRSETLDKVEIVIRSTNWFRSPTWISCNRQFVANATRNG